MEYDKIIRIMHDISLCNSTIENYFCLLKKKIDDNKKVKLSKEKIIKEIDNQINRSKKISKDFFETCKNKE